MDIKLNKRDIERINKREKREQIKSNLIKSLNPIAKKQVKKVSKSRVSCNLRTELADKLLIYVKRKDITFESRSSLLEYIIEDWSRENNIQSIKLEV